MPDSTAIHQIADNLFRKSCRCSCHEHTLLQQYPQQIAELEQYIDSLDLCRDMEKRRGSLIQILHKAQSIFNHLPPDLQEWIADKMDLKLSDINGVITFYAYFTQKPVGKYKINVCTGTACFVRGAEQVLDEFKNILKIGEGESTPDMKFTLSCLRCVGACSLAPVVMVNDKVYGKVTPKMVAGIIKEYHE